MITVATLVRDTPNITNLFNMIKRNMPCDYEIVVGDNSTNEYYSDEIKRFADEYIRITDKQMFRMGIPWTHNLINSIANTYKIFYIDSDEYPVWINPDIERMYDTSYIIPTIRHDFLSMERIEYFDRLGLNYQQFTDRFNEAKESGEIEATSVQDRFYNSRYVEFKGVCHSVFHSPNHFRGNGAGAILLHNKTVREAKDKKRMDELIDEQFAKQNINPYMASSPIVIKWGMGVTHKYDNYEAFKNAYK